MISETEGPREFGRRCRRLLDTSSETIRLSSRYRRLVISDDGWEIYISEDTDGLSVGVCPVNESGEYARTCYEDTGPNSPAVVWIGSTIADVCLPILRKRMILDDLADV